jgi:hypothetical protein
MPTVRRGASFPLLTCVTLMLHAQNSPKVIRGPLQEDGKPIQGAAVFLQSLDDEKCVKLFTAPKTGWRAAKKLEHCLHDLNAASTDADGHYQFVVPKAGWYAVHFLWDIGQKPTHPETAFVQGRWAVRYAGYKDFSGKYDSMAQDGPFFFTGSQDSVRDCELRL